MKQWEKDFESILAYVNAEHSKGKEKPGRSQIIKALGLSTSSFQNAVKGAFRNNPATFKVFLSRSKCTVSTTKKVDKETVPEVPVKAEPETHTDTEVLEQVILWLSYVPKEAQERVVASAVSFFKLG